MLTYVKLALEYSYLHEKFIACLKDITINLHSK